jgi:stage II sporulation protein D
VGAWVAFVVYSSCRTTPVLPPGGEPTPPVAAPSVSPSPTAVPPPAEPSLRIGILTDAARPSIGADSGVLVWSGSNGTVAARPTVVQRATFAPASTAEPGARFRVQVASVTDEAAAQRLARLAERASGETALVRWSDDTRTFQVRVGAYATREQAQAAAARLRQSGLAGAWTPASLDGPVARLRLIETGQEYESVSVAAARADEFLRVDAAEYRGTVEVRAGANGNLTVVNLVNLEDYLRGVVPNELSPSAFPQIEALKAQAVAARTYALRNRGQFAAQGYDLCATPSCQVYKGRSSENALTDRAIAETTGLVALYRGRPINAFYTSTCGGHTEDGANIFDDDAPYLRGVACEPEQSAWTLLHTTAEPRVVGAREGLSRDAALLVALGVLDPRRYASGALDGPVREGELRRWVAQLVAASGRRGCEVPDRDALTRRASFWRHLVGALCWDERAERLLAPGDPDYLLRVEDRRKLGGRGERLAAALLMSEGLLTPFDDNTLRPDAPLARADAVALVAGAALKLRPPALVTAQFRGAARGVLEVSREGQAESLPLEPDLHLFRDLDGRVAATSELSLAVGDTIEYVAPEGRVVFLEAEQSRSGPSADRSSRYFRWEVRATPAELQRSLGSAGPVLDLVPRRYGVSGRVVELGVVGRDGEQLLRGLRIRSALGLRENLFVIDRERDAQGGVRRFVFTGKGWGHGVGLCQVGAFGMAQAGASFDEILRHYYTGSRVGTMP